ncbi:MAG: ADP-forming succinate--CoA ligase subunit beta [Planctomycetota bacterium]|nr:MAG: ADP-forming succinate--CoA ligase subunit beta [Planctomycetota bacterium]
MKIHEYQGKELFREAGIRVPDGQVARSPEEAAQAFEALGGSLAVIKAQVHAGGRGKGTFVEHPDQRGVQLVRSADEAAEAARRMLGNHLVTVQTGPEGAVVHQVLVEAGCEIDRELYLGVVLDRAVARPVLMACSEGGVEIEKIAEETPEKIYREHFHPVPGLASFQVRKLCKKLGISGPAARDADQFMKRLCRLYATKDCSLVEINPLVITKAGEVMALDAKINFDDNALMRHPEIKEMRDLSEEDPAEVRAANAGLSYVKLDGNIGCLVNGAGLAMATMDIIKYYGGEPANFLDVGGGATTEQVVEAFHIILSDPNVKAILVNIFGGIARCTTIAEAIIEASKQVGIKVPLVVRLEGTLVEEGKKMLAESGLPMITADDLADAAQKVVAAVQQSASA